MDGTRSANTTFKDELFENSYKTLEKSEKFSWSHILPNSKKQDTVEQAFNLFSNLYNDFYSKSDTEIGEALLTDKGITKETIENNLHATAVADDIYSILKKFSLYQDMLEVSKEKSKNDSYDENILLVPYDTCLLKWFLQTKDIYKHTNIIMSIINTSKNDNLTRMLIDLLRIITVNADLLIEIEKIVAEFKDDTINVDIYLVVSKTELHDIEDDEIWFKFESDEYENCKIYSKLLKEWDFYKDLITPTIILKMDISNGNYRFEYGRIYENENENENNESPESDLPNIYCCCTKKQDLEDELIHRFIDGTDPLTLSTFSTVSTPSRPFFTIYRVDLAELTMSLKESSPIQEIEEAVIKLRTSDETE